MCSSSVLYLAINLENAVERRSSVLRQAALFGLDIQLVRAVAGNCLDPAELRHYDRQRRAREFASDLTLNEHACILSHCLALRQFLQSDARFGVVLEDDMVLQPGFNEGIDWLTRHTSGWQCLKLYTGDGKLYPLHRREPQAPVELVFPKKLPWVAVGTLYTRAGAALILDGFQRYWMGFDAQWAHILLTRRIPVCGVKPSLVLTSDPFNENSTIDVDNQRTVQDLRNKQDRTLARAVVHRLSVWRTSWGKRRMRRYMRRRLRFTHDR